MYLLTLQRDRPIGPRMFGRLTMPEIVRVAHDLPAGSMFTLEDGLILWLGAAESVRPWHTRTKAPGSTAIPAGTYEIALTWSGRFHRILPMLLDVPQHTAVRLHNGSTERDTTACILVGRRRVETADGLILTASKTATAELVRRLEIARRETLGDLAIQVIDPT
jgi:hypothetical protein